MSNNVLFLVKMQLYNMELFFMVHMCSEKSSVLYYNILYLYFSIVLLFGFTFCVCLSNCSDFVFFLNLRVCIYPVW